MIKKLILIITLFGFNNAHSEVNVVVPFETIHIKYDNKDQVYNENNSGIGGEYVYSDKHVFGALYLNIDSYNNKNFYAYYAFKYKYQKNIILYASVMYPTNYDNLDIAPMIAVSYGYVRVTTTYPFGKLAGAVADIVNIQLIIPSGF